MVNIFLKYYNKTNKKFMDQEQKIISSTLHLLNFATTHNLDELLEETLNEVEKFTESKIGFYHFVDENQEGLTLQNWSTSTKKIFCKAEGKGSHYDISKAGVWVECVKVRKPVIHNDYASLPNKKGMPAGHATVVRELVVPVMRGDKVVAILGAGNKPTDYDENDIKIISMYADLAWGIAELKITEKKLKDKSEELEKINRIMVGREMDMIKLKEENEKLKNK